MDQAVGAAIRDSGVPRSSLFITSKFWPHWAAPENVPKCLDKVLSDMGLDYLDLFLAHWPLALQPVPDLDSAIASPTSSTEERGIEIDANGKPVRDWEHTAESIARENGHKGSYKPTWQALQTLVGTGKIRAAGVSNFTIEQLKEVLAVGGNVPVSCNQIEAHPWLPNTELLEFMEEQGIIGTAYAPLGGRGKNGMTLVGDPKVKQLAQNNGMDTGQLLQSWAVQRGTIPLGKSQTEG